LLTLELITAIENETHMKSYSKRLYISTLSSTTNKHILNIDTYTAPELE